MEEKVEITKLEYDTLIERSEWLDHLENAGVDNWSGYSVAQELSKESRMEDM